MSATIAVSCPKCKKTLQLPESVKGKKIKCKSCGEIFPALEGPAKTLAEDPKARPNQAKGKELDDEWGVVKAYGVTTEDLSPRCPYCAAKLESDEDVVCLECGYNLQTRERMQERVLEPVTGGDYFLWLLPGIICGIVALLNIGDILFALVLLIAPPEEWRGSSFYRACVIYGSVFSGFIAFFTGRFAVKRLILNPHPPEKEKTLKKEEPGK